MNKQLIIVLTGKKQSGKNSTCNFILSEFANRAFNKARFSINDKGELVKDKGSSILGFGSDGHIMTLHEQTNLMEVVKAKIYSFADPLKRFCIDVLGLPEEACYGTEAQKNQIIEHILWENFPKEARPFLDGFGKVLTLNVPANKSYDSNGKLPVLKSGPMTGREVMQAFGTDIIRKIYSDAWARGTYSSIKRDGYSLALICDGRFPNEIEMSNSLGAKTIRLTRSISVDSHPSETALDNFPIEKYSLYIDNAHMSLKEQCEVLRPILMDWIRDASI